MDGSSSSPDALSQVRPGDEQSSQNTAQEAERRRQESEISRNRVRIPDEVTDTSIAPDLRLKKISDAWQKSEEALKAKLGIGETVEKSAARSEIRTVAQIRQEYDNAKSILSKAIAAGDNEERITSLVVDVAKLKAELDSNTASLEEAKKIIGEKDVSKKESIIKKLKDGTKNFLKSWWKNISPQGKHKLSWGLGMGVGVVESIAFHSFLPPMGGWLKAGLNALVINTVNRFIGQEALARGEKAGKWKSFTAGLAAGSTATALGYLASNVAQNIGVERMLSSEVAVSDMSNAQTHMNELTGKAVGMEKEIGLFDVKPSLTEIGDIDAANLIGSANINNNTTLFDLLSNGSINQEVFDRLTSEPFAGIGGDGFKIDPSKSILSEFQAISDPIKAREASAMIFSNLDFDKDFIPDIQQVGIDKVKGLLGDNLAGMPEPEKAIKISEFLRDSQQIQPEILAAGETLRGFEGNELFHNNIQEFVTDVKAGDVDEALKVIGVDPARPNLIAINGLNPQIDADGVISVDNISQIKGWEDLPGKLEVLKDINPNDMRDVAGLVDPVTHKLAGYLAITDPDRFKAFMGELTHYQQQGQVLEAAGWVNEQVVKRIPIDNLVKFYTDNKDSLTLDSMISLATKYAQETGENIGKVFEAIKNGNAELLKGGVKVQ